MREPTPRTVRRPARSLLVAATAILAAALVAGCTGPGLSPSAPPAIGDLQMATTHGSAPPSCGAKTLLEDDQLILQKGRGGKDFLLQRPCAITATLTLREAAGTLVVRLDGPQGPVFERNFNGLAGPVSTVNLGSTGGSSGSNSPAPAGTYHYTFEAHGAASFEFRVKAP